MVFIGSATQNRILDLAKRQFGPGGDAVIRETAQHEFGLPIEQITFIQLTSLFGAIERNGPARVGAHIAGALAAALDQLYVETENNLCPRLLQAVGRHLGRAAQPFIETVCQRLGFLPDTVDRARLVEVAREVELEAAPFLGGETARTLAVAVLDCGDTLPPGLARRIVNLACEHLGQDGEPFIRRLCRERLEVHVEELNVVGVAMLARAVERYGPEMIGAVRVAAFLTAARTLLTNPNEQLQRKILELVTRRVGPAGRDFLNEICLANGLPFEAVDYEHLMWLAEMLRREAAVLAGAKGAEELARAVRGLLTGAR